MSPPCARCSSVLHPSSAHGVPAPTPPAPEPTLSNTRFRAPEPDDGEAIWVDSVGHRLTRSDDSTAWVHLGGPVRDCPSVLYILHPPPEDVAEIPGFEDKFRRRRRYVLAFEVEDGEAPT